MGVQQLANTEIRKFKLKDQLPGQVHREVISALGRVIDIPLPDIDKTLKDVRSALELGAFQYDKPNLELTGSFLSPPFNSSGAMSIEETAYVVLEIEKAHQVFEQNQGLRRKAPDTDNLNAEQSLVAMLALNKGEGAVFSNWQFGKQILHFLGESGKVVLNKIFPDNPMVLAEEMGIHYDNRNSIVGSTEERLAQLQTEVNRATRTFYSRFPETISAPLENLSSVLHGEHTEEEAFQSYARDKERVLRGLGPRDYRILGTMRQVISDLHPSFTKRLEQKWLLEH